MTQRFFNANHSNKSEIDKKFNQRVSHLANLLFGYFTVE